MGIQVSITIMGLVECMIVVVMMSNCVTTIAASAHVFKAFKSIVVSGSAVQLKI
jgi:hypothetical protein